MKQPKRIPRKFKECLSAYHLNTKNWMLVAETELYIKVIHKETRKIRTLDKFRKEGRR